MSGEGEPLLSELRIADQDIPLALLLIALLMLTVSHPTRKAK